MAVCRNPFITLTLDVAPCGRCPECLVNRKQMWTNRNILESLNHKKKCFVTLTYSEENLPKNNEGHPTLVKSDLQNYIKRLRSWYPPKSIRYYAVGEYGTAGERGINPHYHILFYGLDETDSQKINLCWTTAEGKGKEGQQAGFTYVDDLNPQTIAYVVGYVEKKTKYNSDMYEELGIVPEFSMMSLRPTIGHGAISVLVDLFKNHPEYLTEYGDVPYSINHGSRALPLGQYIREKVREGLDLPHDVAVFCDDETGEITERKIWHGKENYKEQKKLEMQALQNAPEDFDKKMSKDARISTKKLLQYLNSQAHKNFDAKQQFKRQNKTL